MMRLSIAFSILFLCACSKIETGLNFAPRIATSKIDDAFDFKSEKLTRIKKQIDTDIQASKKTLANKLISHIETLEKLSQESDLKKEQLISFFNDWSETQTTLLESFRSSANVTLKDLTPAELENFKSYSEKKYAEELTLAKDKKAFLKKKKKSFVKNYELFFNSLTGEQEALLDTFLDNHFDYFKQRILSHQKISEETYLKIKSQDLVLDFFLAQYGGKKYESLIDAQLKKYLDDFFNFQIAFWKLTTDKQKIYYRKMLGGYKDELIKISSK